MNRNDWYLKANDETFGPESRDRLVEWAKMGRILPGQEISLDGETWYPVTDVPFLDMRWSIDPGDGNPRGPFNRAAADALLKSGRLPPTATLVEVRAPFGDEPFPPPDEPVENPGGPEPAPAGEQVRPGDEASAPRGAANESPAERAAMDAERAKLASERAAFEAEKAKLENSRRRLEGEKQRLEEEKRKLESAKSDLESEKESLAAELASAKSAADAGLAEVKSMAEAELAEVKSAAEAELAAVKAESAAELAAVKAEDAESLAKARAEAAEELQRAKTEAAEAEKRLGTELERCGRENAELAERLKGAEARVCDLERQLEDTISDREKQLALADTRLRDARADAAAAIEAGAKQHASDAEAIADANDRAELAAKRVADAERQYADLLEQSNIREKEYQTRIARLGDELQRVPPDSAAAAAATAAIFELMQMEADDIARTLEQEKRDAENARQVWLKREDRLLARRQDLLKRIGDGPSNMLKRAVGDHPEDAQTVRLREELDKFKQMHESMMRESERRAQEAAEKLKRYEAENSRLRSASSDGALASAQIQQLRQELTKREKEIVELRQNVANAERARAVMEQTMQARINTMESAPLLPNIETTQAREAKHVKLASWMRFSK